jgi:hypothetical protein
MSKVSSPIDGGAPSRGAPTTSQSSSCLLQPLCCSCPQAGKRLCGASLVFRSLGLGPSVSAPGWRTKRVDRSENEGGFVTAEARRSDGTDSVSSSTCASRSVGHASGDVLPLPMLSRSAAVAGGAEIHGGAAMLNRLAGFV